MDCDPLIKKEWMDLAVIELTAGAYPCGTEAQLREDLDFYWNEHSKVCYRDNYLRYLFSLREGYKNLMLCYSTQVDIRTAAGENHARSLATGRQEGWTQAQGQNNSRGRSDSTATAFYDDHNEGDMTMSSWRKTSTWAFDDELRRMDDTSEGKNVSDANAHTLACTADLTRSGSISRVRGESRGARSGCDYTYSDELTSGSTSAGTLLIFTVTGSSQASATNWVHDMHHTEKLRAHNDAASGTASKKQHSGDAGRVRNSTTVSHFYAHVDSDAVGSSVSRSDEGAHSEQRETAHAEGYGQSVSTAKGEGGSTATGHNKSHDEGETQKDGFNDSWSSGDDFAFSQRFRHIMDLYQQNESIITRRLKELRGNQKPQVITPCYNLCLAPEYAQCSCGRLPSKCACGCNLLNTQRSMQLELA